MQSGQGKAPGSPNPRDCGVFHRHPSKRSRCQGVHREGDQTEEHPRHRTHPASAIRSAAQETQTTQDTEQLLPTRSIPLLSLFSVKNNNSPLLGLKQVLHP